MSLKIAFYAPMKSPDHETPSGDRTIARLLMAAMEQAGHSVHPISRFRSWAPSPEQQAALRARVYPERQRASDVLSALRPDLWLTYHLSFKAPDWLGPALCARFGILYLIAEASDAPGQACGPWSKGVANVRTALGLADAIFLMKEHDRPALERQPGVGGKLVSLPPFVDPVTWPEADRGDRSGPARLLSVAMMRPGDKLASYHILAAALAQVRPPWQLTIVGDGPARAEVSALFQPFGAKVAFAGAMEGTALQAHYQDADVFVWPGIGEGIGMVYLEAQASGLPVAACATGGVPEVVRPGETGLLSSASEPRSLASAITTLITDHNLRRHFGRNAASHVRTRHGMANAQLAIHRVLRERTLA